MRFLTILLLGLGIALLGTNALAQDSKKPFSPTEEQAIGEIVREYLLENPEILQEISAVLKNRADAVRASEMIARADENRDALERDGFSGVIGNPDGKITVVEFFDYQCPFCRRAHASVAQLIAANPDVRVLVKQFPIKDVPDSQPLSMLGAYMAMAAQRQGKFAEFHAAIHTGDLPMTQSKLLQAIAEAGIDRARFDQDVSDPILAGNIRGTYELARTIGVSSTPTFIIGREIVFGALGYDALQSAVDKERARLGSLDISDQP